MGRLFLFLWALLGFIAFTKGQTQCSNGETLSTLLTCPDTCDNIHTKKNCAEASKVVTNCRCNSGYILSSKGVCQPLNECLKSKCGPNEIFKQIPCKFLCENKIQRKQCFPSTAPGCDCMQGYYYSKDGRCVTEAQCYEQPGGQCENGVYKSSSRCTQTCKNMFITKECTNDFRGGCVCDDGYYLNSKGQCVLPKNCEEFDVICPEKNTAFSATSCVKTCSNLLLGESCVPNNHAHCACKSGFYLNSRGVCVTQVECEREDVCGARNAIFKKEPCNNLCEDLLVSKRCVPNTTPGCQCNIGYYLNRNGNCVRPADCIGVNCEQNAVFKSSGCEYTCKSYLQNTDCKKINFASCTCDANSYRNSDNNCVSVEKCLQEKDVCPINSIAVLKPCSKTCHDMFDPVPCTGIERPGCECKSGYFKNSEGKCVLDKECDNVFCKDTSTIFKESICEETCRTVLLGERCVDKNILCACKDGLYRNSEERCVTKEECRNDRDICSIHSNFKEKPCSKTCLELFGSSPCNEEVDPGCECNAGYYKNKEGLCIQSTECDFVNCNKENTIFKSKSCEHTCKTFLNEEKCIAFDYPTCTCKDRFYRNSLGECITAESCKIDADVCPPNSEFSFKPCSKTCFDMFETDKCIEETSPGCQCFDGYFKTGEGLCVKNTECIEVYCERNSVFKSSECEHTCRTHLFGDKCVNIETPSCACDTGYYRNSKGECVDRNACMVENDICPNNTAFKEYPCSNTCNDMFVPGGCHPDDKPGCECNQGYYKNSEGVCVLEDQCDDVYCEEENAEFMTTCEYTCKAKLLGEQCVENNRPTCACMEGFYRTSDGHCVDLDDCKLENDICPVRMQFNDEPCSRTCLDLLTEDATCEKLNKPGCQCDNGYYKNSKGVCVELHQCDIVKCGNHSEFRLEHCADTCRSHLFKEECDPVPQPACACKKGYYKNTQGKCVSEDECKEDTGLCSGFSTFNMNPCNRRCSDMFNIKECISENRPGCQCDDGYFKDDHGVCVPQSQCVNVHCGMNSAFALNGCEGTCKTHLLHENCINVQQPKCFCLTGYYRDSTGNCVDENQCKSDRDICPLNSNYSDRPCSKTCQDMFDDECVEEEIGGCECLSGYYKNRNGFCVKANQCVGVKCKQPNTVFKPIPCHHTCKTFLYGESCISHEVPACICKDNYYLNSNNECVDAQTCRNDSDVCGAHSSFKDKPCHYTCSEMYTSDDCIPDEGPGCQYEDGYYMNSEGVCVEQKDCDDVVCKPNSVFTTNQCEYGCYSHLFGKNCTTIEGSACTCDDNHYRNSEDQCVSEDSCVLDTGLCPENSEFSKEPCSHTCKDMFILGCSPEPQWGCQCKTGYYKNKNGECVSREMCDDVKCNENMIFEITSCEHTCKSHLFNTACLPSTEAHCTCQKDFYRNHIGECVTSEECRNEPDICPPNQEFVDRPCSRTCLGMFFDDCVPLSTAGCQCKQGFFMNADGDCVSSYQCDKVNCHPNAVFSKDPCEHTCKSILFGESCANLSSPRCTCVDGYAKNSVNECVAKDSCKTEKGVCPEHSSFKDIVLCDTSCGNMIINEGCEPKTNACGCDEGYYMKKNGQCVRAPECDEVMCEEHATFKPTGCEYTCSAFLQNATCKQNSDDCICTEGFYRHSNGRCVSVEECVSDTEICPEKNTIFDTNACELTCKDFLTEEECTSERKPGCRCMDGYYRDKGVCISTAECSDRQNDICPRYSVYRQEPLIKTCENMFGEIVRSTKPDCECVDGFFMDVDEVCVTAGSCKNVTCPENSIFQQNPCTLSCKGHLFKEKCKKCERCELPKCVCKSGYYLHSNGQCVQSEDCRADPEVCGPHGTYELQPCNKQCANMFTGAQCVLSKKPGCQCNEGYFTNSKGKCVLPEECDNVKCPKFAYFDPWSFDCETTCENMLLELPCNSKNHTPACNCMQGYVKNANGACIDPVRCLPAEIQCPKNLVYDKCGNRHHRHCGQDCDSVDKTAPCIAACYCNKDRLYDDVIGSCVEEHECTISFENIACKSIDPFLRYNNCHDGPAKTCLNLDMPQPLSPCNAGCYCVDGYVLNEYNHCVPVETCGKSTPPYRLL